MNRIAALLLMVLVGPCVGIGQSVSPKADAGTPDTLRIVPGKFDADFARQANRLAGANCPVGLRAQPASGASMVVTKSPNKDTGNFQQLHLTFANRRSREIVAVSVTIRGFDATARTLLLDSRSQDSPNLAKTVDLKLDVATGKNVETDVTLRSFASISRVDLESVEYADGTSWKATGLQSCHIVPDRFMLVGAH